MSDLNGATSVWVLYSVAAVAFVIVFWRWIDFIQSRSLRVVLSCSVLVLLVSPVAVPGTDNLAPAWLVALFELALGRTVVAQNAIRPALIILAITYAVLLLLLLRKLYLRRQT